MNFCNKNWYQKEERPSSPPQTMNTNTNTNLNLAHNPTSAQATGQEPVNDHVIQQQGIHQTITTFYTLKCRVEYAGDIDAFVSKMVAKFGFYTEWGFLISIAHIALYPPYQAARRYLGDMSEYCNERADYEITFLSPVDWGEMREFLASIDDLHVMEQTVLPVHIYDAKPDRAVKIGSLRLRLRRVPREWHETNNEIASWIERWRQSDRELVDEISADLLYIPPEPEEDDDRDEIESKSDDRDEIESNSEEVEAVFRQLDADISADVLYIPPEPEEDDDRDEIESKSSQVPDTIFLKVNGCCSICLDEWAEEAVEVCSTVKSTLLVGLNFALVELDRPVVVLKCGHPLHLACVKSLLMENEAAIRCPMCREPFY